MGLEKFLRETKPIRARSLSLGVRSIGEEDALLIYTAAYTYASSRHSGLMALDAGAGIGYSTLWLAKALEDAGCSGCRVVGIEHSPARCREASRIASTARFEGVELEFVEGDALSYVKGLDRETVDIAFVDVEKPLYPDMLRLLESRLKPGGIALFHNAYFPPPPRGFASLASQKPWRSTMIPTATGGLLLAIRMPDS